MKKIIRKSYFKNIKTFVFIIASNLYYLESNAQSTQLNSQFFINQYLINPAFAGIERGLNVNVNYRKQWSDVPGAPSTQQITADYGLNKIGIGLNVMHEKAGVLERTKAMSSYAYHLPVGSDDQKLIFGASFGFIREYLSFSEINGDITDEQLANFSNKGSTIEGDFGIAYTSKQLQIDAALPNLTSIVDKNRNNIDQSLYYVALGYKINFPYYYNSIEINPKIVYRKIRNYGNHFDIGANFNFTNNLFLMGMYHSSKSATFGAGVNYKSSLMIMGFYTTNTAALQRMINGTFEISLKANLFK